MRWPRRCRAGRGSTGSRRGGGTKAENERLRATITEHAVALPLHEGKARWG